MAYLFRQRVRRIIRAPAQGQAPTLQSQRIGGDRKRLGAPVRAAMGRDVLHPGVEAAHRVGRQRAHVFRHGLLICQPRIHHALHGPGRLAKLRQAHHARAALERMERPTQRRLLRHVTRLAAQSLDRFAAALHHLACFIEEDVEQVVVLQVVVTRRGRRGGFRCGHRHAGRGLESLQRARQFCGVVRARGFRCALRDLRQLRLFIQRRPGGDLVQLTEHRCVRLGGVGQLGRRLDLWRHVVDVERHVHGARVEGGRHGHGRTAQAPGHMPQLARGGVVHEQPACEHGLVSQHVDLKAQGAQAVAQPFEGARRAGGLDVRILQQKLAHRIAHVADRGGGLIKPQHRQHAPHLAHEAGHGRERAGVRRVAEELVQVLLDLAQRDAQLTHHRAHGLAIAHAAIQILHPRLKGRRHGALAYRIQALRQLAHARGKGRVARPEVGKRGFEEQHRGRHLHGKFGMGRLARLRNVLRRLVKHFCQRPALLMQLFERFGHHAELVDARFHARQITAGQHGPVFLDLLDPPPGLDQQRRVIQAEGGLVVARGRLTVQRPGFSHARQCGCIRRRRWRGLAAEKQQVVRQALRHALITARQRSELQQHA